MFLNIPIIADLHLLQQNRQAQFNKQLLLANTKRFFDYHIGQKVLKLTISPSKLDPFYEGPYLIHTESILMALLPYKSHQ